MTSCRAWYHWKAQATTALAYVGATVVVDGSTAQLTGGNANWSLTSPSRRQLQSLSRIRPVRTSIPAHCSQSRHAEFHLERPRQRRPSLARRRLYPHRHGSRHQQAIGCHFRGTGDRRFCRSHAGPGRSCRSMDRTTRSTRSSGLSGRPHDRGMARCEVLAFNYYRLLTRSAS